MQLQLTSTRVYVVGKKCHCCFVIVVVGCVCVCVCVWGGGGGVYGSDHPACLRKLIRRNLYQPCFIFLRYKNGLRYFVVCM